MLREYNCNFFPNLRFLKLWFSDFFLLYNHSCNKKIFEEFLEQKPVF
jgi:hypothetical protein